MNQARRTLGCWILAAFLERGCDPTTARIPQPARRERPLTAAELREYNGPLAQIRFLPRRRAAGDTPLAGGAPARLLAFPAR
jgi:hypothetical protein